MSKKAGRPPKDAANRRDTRLSVRISTALRNRLEHARLEDGERSLSEEVELRLRESFETNKQIEERFGGKGTSRILQIVADRIGSIETSTELRWFDDRYTYDQVKAMVDVIFAHFKPAGRRTIPKPMQWHLSLKKDVENLGRHVALLALATLESARDHPKESDLPAQYGKAALPVGRRLRGSPSEELEKERKQSLRRRFRKKIERQRLAAAGFDIKK